MKSPQDPTYARLKVVPPLVINDRALLLWSLHHTLRIHTLWASCISCKYRCDPADLQQKYSRPCRFTWRYASVSQSSSAPNVTASYLCQIPARTKQATRYFTQVTRLPFHLLELNIFSHKKSERTISYPPFLVPAQIILEGKEGI